VLDLRGISSFTDFFVICSGTSEPQLKAIANEIETRLREHYSLRPWQLTDFPPANGWSSIIYKWSSTFFIATNAPSTAWRFVGRCARAAVGISLKE
jgi:hypothetical protein